MDRPLVFATLLSPNVYPVYQAAVAKMSRDTGLDIDLVRGNSYSAFFGGSFDGVFVCGLPYILMTRIAEPPMELLAAPVLRGQRYGDRPVYFSDVIVRRDSSFQTFLDLRGGSWAFNERLSHSGYGVVRHHLVSIGKTAGFFGKVIEARFHLNSIEMVANGRVDGAAIDTQVLEIEFTTRPELRNRLRVIEALGPSSIQPVLVSCKLPKPLRAKLRESILSLHDDPEAGPPLEAAGVSRFEAIQDSSYDDLRKMLAAVEESGMDHLGGPPTKR
ncbi:MAG: PhnD/SsuA/transferrin family substrate-binding protein [Actinobacteria bacterium]|nr:PhnD/SsuA/transferrin family substrate-binding protein [Actinomycetota bacterium]